MDFQPDVINPLTHNSNAQDARLQYERVRYAQVVAKFKDHKDEGGAGLHSEAAQGFIEETNGGIRLINQGFNPTGFFYVPVSKNHA